MQDFNISPKGWQVIESIAAIQVDAVLTEIEDDALRTVPFDSGDLYDSIKKNYTPGNLEGTVSVGTDHWAPTEYGSRPHYIRAVTKKVLSDGKSIFGKTVYHPGTPEQSFMRTSLYKKRTLRKRSG